MSELSEYVAYRGAVHIREAHFHSDNSGVEARSIVFEGGYHAFELNCPNSTIGKKALSAMKDAWQYAVKHYFAGQEKQGETK